MVIRRMRVRVPPQLGGGLATLCGVNAGANTCANPGGATAAPFRALQGGERFASRRTTDTPKSRNAGPHPQGTAVACGAAGPPAVVRRQRLSAISSAFGWTAAASAHSKQRSIDLSPCCRTARRLMLSMPSMRMALGDHKLRPSATCSTTRKCVKKN